MYISVKYFQTRDFKYFFSVSGNWHDKKQLRNFGTCYILEEKVYKC